METENITKEQLEKEINSLQMENNSHLSRDEERRKEFAQSFNWREAITPFDPSDEALMAPSWEQIFVKTGKLLEIANQVEEESELKRANNKIHELRYVLGEIRNKQSISQGEEDRLEDNWDDNQK